MHGARMRLLAAAACLLVAAAASGALAAVPRPAGLGDALALAHPIEEWSVEPGCQGRQQLAVELALEWAGGAPPAGAAPIACAARIAVQPSALGSPDVPLEVVDQVGGQGGADTGAGREHAAPGGSAWGGGGAARELLDAGTLQAHPKCLGVREGRSEGRAGACTLSAQGAPPRRSRTSPRPGSPLLPPLPPPQTATLLRGGEAALVSAQLEWQGWWPRESDQWPVQVDVECGSGDGASDGGDLPVFGWASRVMALARECGARFPAAIAFHWGHELQTLVSACLIERACLTGCLFQCVLS